MAFTTNSTVSGGGGHESGEQYGGHGYAYWQSQYDSLTSAQQESLNRYVYATGYDPGTSPKRVLQALANIATGSQTWEALQEKAKEGFTPEEKLQQKEEKRIQDLKDTEEKKGADLLKTQKEDYAAEEEKRGVARKAGRARLAELLAGVGERAFTKSIPDIEESLSAQGLLHSSALGSELARKKADIAQNQSDILANAEMTDTTADIDWNSENVNNLFNTKSGLYNQSTALDILKETRGHEFDLGQLERTYSMRDNAYQSDLINKMLDAQKKQNNINSFMQLAGLGLGGYAVFKK